MYVSSLQIHWILVPLKSCWVMILHEKKIAVKFRMIIGLAIMYWADLEVKIRLSPDSTYSGRIQRYDSMNCKKTKMYLFVKKS